MTLINNIIKKYEQQAAMRISEARASRQAEYAPQASTSVFNATSSPEQTVSLEKPAVEAKRFEAPKLDLTTKNPTPQDFAYFEWQNKMVDFYKNLEKANRILADLQASSALLQELERIRAENTELKEKVRALSQK